MINIITINKATGWRGVASQEGEHFAIYEGNPDGSDDKTITAAEFEQNYFAKTIDHEELEADYLQLEKEIA